MRIIKGLMLAIALSMMPACYFGEVVDSAEPSIVFYQGAWGYWYYGMWYAAPAGFVWHSGVHIYWGHYYGRGYRGPSRIWAGGYHGGHFNHRR